MQTINDIIKPNKTILDKIVEQTKEDLIKKKKKLTSVDFRGFEVYQHKRKNFKSGLRKVNDVKIIAEIKKASPSKGIIRQDFNPLKIAEQYQEAGAAALSVLTEPFFFQGSLDYLVEIRRRFDLPLLRKDFIVDFYQVEEARAYGADAILLIVSILDGSLLEELLHAASEAGLQCLVECYNQDDFDRLDMSKIQMLGVNNRDLNTFEVNVHQGIKILEQAPEGVIKISESGLSHPDDLKLLRDHGIDAALIGEHFMRQSHPGDALKRMVEGLHS